MDPGYHLNPQCQQSIYQTKEVSIQLGQVNECHSEVTRKVTKAQPAVMWHDQLEWCRSKKGNRLFNHQQLLFFKQQTTNLSKSHVCLRPEWNELFEGCVSMFKRAIKPFSGVMMEINLCWKEEYAALACFMKIPTKKVFVPYTLRSLLALPPFPF